MSTIVGTNIEVTNIKFDSDTTAMIVSSAGGGAGTVPEGLTKVWLSSQADATTEDSFGVSTTVDNGTGNYRYNFTTNFANAHYASTTDTADFTHNGSSQNPRVSHIGSRGTSNVIIHQAYYNSSAIFIYYDGTDLSVQLNGELI